jgi:hypothetical protein
MRYERINKLTNHWTSGWFCLDSLFAFDKRNRCRFSFALPLLGVREGRASPDRGKPQQRQCNSCCDDLGPMVEVGVIRRLGVQARNRTLAIAKLQIPANRGRRRHSSASAGRLTAKWPRVRGIRFVMCSRDRRLLSPRSGRNSTYPAVQISGAASELTKARSFINCPATVRRQTFKVRAVCGNLTCTICAGSTSNRCPYRDRSILSRLLENCFPPSGRSKYRDRTRGCEVNHRLFPIQQWRPENLVEDRKFLWR